MKLTEEIRDRWLPTVRVLEIFQVLLVMFAFLANDAWDRGLRLIVLLPILAAMLCFTVALDLYKLPANWTDKLQATGADLGKARDYWACICLMHLLAYGALGAVLFINFRSFAFPLWMFGWILTLAMYRQYEKLLRVEFLSLHLPIGGSKRPKDTPRAT